MKPTNVAVIVLPSLGFISSCYSFSTWTETTSVFTSRNPFRRTDGFENPLLLSNQIFPRQRRSNLDDNENFSPALFLSSSTITEERRSFDESDESSNKTVGDKSMDPRMSDCPHESFDYLSHWYPVSWSRDLKLDKPTKVTVFDDDYVIAKIEKDGKEEEVIAMLDRCPHKSAALSEGRITKCGKSFQCAYHGWTFDSKTGECIDIPQVAPDVNDLKSGEGVKSRSKERKSGIDLQANGVAVPAMIVNGMVWIFPGGGIEEVVKALPPPSIPDLEKDGYRLSGEIVRDFPIDWTVLLENIMDPDHGLFAHQDPPFDLYTASKTNPQLVEETTSNNGKGWSITSNVDATFELLLRNEESGQTKKKPKYSTKEGTQVLKSSVTFVAPNMIYMGRRNDQNESNFITAFFITPTGTGKSRFMACQITKMPKWVNIPRWIFHIALNNFLDQDTYLLATQQRHVLALESQLSMEIEQNGTATPNVDIPVRKKLYKYRSPTEKLGSKVGNWLDATISRVPNRFPAVLAIGGYRSGLAALASSRNEVLDRYSQHTAICGDSLSLVEKLQKIQKVSILLSLIPVLFRLFIPLGTNTAAISGGGISSFVHSLLFKINRLLTPRVVFSIWIISAMASCLCKKLQNEFKFKYTEKYRDRDMEKIPYIWMDQM